MRRKAREQSKARRRNDIEGERAKLRAYTRSWRRQVIEKYGGKCACCGESTQEFLTIDHIYGGGTKHRKALGGSNALLIYLKNLEGAETSNYRVLCYNCNCARGHAGYCPHER